MISQEHDGCWKCDICDSEFYYESEAKEHREECFESLIWEALEDACFSCGQNCEGCAVDRLRKIMKSEERHE